jgi:DnaK suppressor protein
MATRTQNSTAKRSSPKSPAPAKRRLKNTNGAGSEKYAAIRRDLKRQRQILLGDAVEAISNRRDFEQFPDFSDQATAEVDQHFTLRLREREQKLIKKIDEALERMATRTYGICERCGGTIPYKRLKARPVTTLCIECKREQELEEKLRR